MTALSVSDRLELSALVHRYAAAVDDRDIGPALELFCDTAELVLPEPPDSLDPVRSHRGAEQIRAALGAVTAIDRTRHSIDSEVYTPTDARVRGRIAACAHHWTAGPAGITDVVWYLRYDDDYVRTEQGWRIARRVLTIDAIETRAVRRLRRRRPVE